MILRCPNVYAHTVEGSGVFMPWCEPCSLRGTYVRMVIDGDHPLAQDPRAGLVSGDRLHTIDIERYPTGFRALDRLTGGGFGVGGCYLFSGPPGSGKSTLATQIGAQLAPTCYLAAEEGLFGLKERAMRIGALPAEFYIGTETNLSMITDWIEGGQFHFAVIDSIQMLYSPDLPGKPGSPSQVVACGQVLHGLAHATDTTILLLCHVTKEGDAAGPRTLGHLVDAVLELNTEDLPDWIREIRVTKNRLGAAPVSEFFQIQDNGAWRDVSFAKSVASKPRSTSAPARARSDTPS